MPEDRYRPRGALDRKQKLDFARRAATAQLAGLPGVVKAALGKGGPSGAMTLPETPPDSSATRAAVELAESVYGEQLHQHCLRCWYFGAAFAQLDGHRFDPEALFIAALLHDIALTDRCRPAPGQSPCFAVHGGSVARDRLLAWGASTELANLVDEAIALHMDVAVDPAQGVEAHLLHAAAHLDVAGTRIGDLPRPLLADIVRMHPRDGFTGAFLSAMRREARDRPDSRAAVMWKLGMRLPVSMNPLNRSSAR
ncbi:HD domain-containing protein [Nocardia cyriacigeorgica]|uniref:HD domain-containing protein n=1 Tax=Nocardia cyriacigeorgica TaxID=135487 RepID=UPI002455DC1B|nr:HD domain-containing protein [Nocardia cyriacigeorgica]